MVNVVELNEIDRLARYSNAWQVLHAKTLNATYFQTLSWLESYWKHFGSEKRLRVLVVEVDGEPIGIVPLVEQVELTRIGKVTALTYPLASWGPFYGPIGSDLAATWSAAFAYLAGMPRTWDVLDLRWIDSSIDRGRIATAMRCRGFSPRTLPWDPTYQVNFSNMDLDSYLASRRTKFRQQLRKSLRRLHEEGDLYLQRYRPTGEEPADCLPDMSLYEECVDLSSRSWQGDSTTGTTLCHEETAQFFQDTFVGAVQDKMMDLAVLRYKGIAIAFSYNYHCRGYVLGLRAGFDPAYKKESPGLTIMIGQIADGISRGDSIYDLGISHQEVKTRWMTDQVSASRVCHYAPGSIAANVLRWGHWWKHRQTGEKGTPGSPATQAPG